MASASNSRNDLGFNYLLSVSFTETNVSTPDNTSTISCTGTLKAQGTYWTSSYDSSLSVYWHDDKDNIDRLVSSITFKGMSGNYDSKSTSGEITISHKTDGKLNGYAWVRFTKGQTTSAYAPSSGDVSTSWTALTNIDRYPIITSAPNFNDEENPTVNFSTTLGFSGATVQICILKTDNTPLVGYRPVNVSSGSYTFNFTTAERNSLRNGTPNSNTLNVKFVLRTTVNSTNYYSNETRQLTIVNANPTFTDTEVETNSKVITLLGTDNANTIIQNASKMKVTIVPTALKGATISKVRVTHDVTYTGEKTSSPYEFIVPIVSRSTILKVVDSRENVATRIAQKTLIEYTPVKLTSLTLKRENSTSSNVMLTLEARYLQKTINSHANAPVIQWKLGSGSYTTIPSSAYTIDTTNNKVKVTNYRISSVLPYTQKGTFTIKVSDFLTEDEDKRDVIKGIPTFDYGEHDLKVNGDLYIADTNGENAVNVKNLHKVNISTSGVPCKTGRLINNKEEYIYYQHVYSLPNTTAVIYETTINIADIEFVSDIGGTGVRSSTNDWFVFNCARISTVNNISVGGTSTNNHFGFYVEAGADRSSLEGWLYVKFTYKD